MTLKDGLKRMSKLKVVILGNVTDDMMNSGDCFHLVTYCVGRSLINLGVEIELVPYDDYANGKKIPQCDYVMVSMYIRDKFNPYTIKLDSGAKKIFSVLEVPHSKEDYSFVFNPTIDRPNVEFVGIPYPKNVLSPLLKLPKTVLVDHCWDEYVGTDKDWTHRIDNWVKDLVEDGYTIYRMTKFEDDVELVKKYETPIATAVYPEYLNSTALIANFVVTHNESYGYGLIDMAVRGTRVMAPRGFIPKFMKQSLDVKEFRSKDTLLKIIRKPFREEDVSSCVENLNSYDNIAEIIYDRMLEWENE